MDLLDKTSVVYDKMSFCCERFENYMLSSERNEEDLKRILTTMQEMKKVVDYAKEKNCKAKIMIGGAVITEDYTEQICADGYAKDAAEAVKVVQSLLAQ